MKKLEDEFCPYEQALALKELGFDEPCFKLIETNGIQRIAVNNDYSNKLIDDVGDEQIYFTNQPDSMYYATIPLYSQAFRWFREKYGLCASFTMNITCGWRICVLPNCDIYISSEFEKELYPKTFNKNTYEEAELECLKKLIEIVKSK